jgi:hypothetical protein
MQATLECTDGGWLLDNAPVSMSSLLAESDSKVYYCWGITDCIAQCLSSMPDSEVKALQRLLDSDSIVDLRIAAYLYCSANGRNEVLRLSDYGENVSDAAWLTKHIPARTICKILRGRVATEVSRQHGVPISEESLKVSIKALSDTGCLMADVIHETCPTIWETAKGVPILDKFGLPFLVDSVYRKSAVDAVYSMTGLRYELATPLSTLGQLHPDVKHVQDLLRFKHIKKDLHRMKRWLDAGFIQPEKVTIDCHGMTKSYSPCLDEPAFRVGVFAKDCMVTINFNELALKIAQDQSRRIGRPLWPNAKSLSHLGATAMQGRGKHPTHVKVGKALLQGIVVNLSAPTVASMIWGHAKAYSKVKTLKTYIDRCSVLNDSDKYSDAWGSLKEDSLRYALGANWQECLPPLQGISAVDALLTIVGFGDDPLCGLPKEFVEAVWRLLEDKLTDLHAVGLVKKRAHGSSLLRHVAPQRSVNAYGLVLDNTTRSSAGLWAVYGSVHEVMRQCMWLLWRRHGYYLHGISQNSIAVSPAGEMTNDVVDQCHAAIEDSQHLVLGCVMSHLSMEVSRRWR